MIRYLLDTDTAIEVFQGRNARAVSALAANSRQNVALSVVTVAEMVFGAHRSAGRAGADLETAGPI